MRSIAKVILALSVHVGMALFQHRASRTDTVSNLEKPTWQDWKLCDSTVHSNIVGDGPDEGAEEIRYGKVTTADDSDKEIDMVVAIASGEKGNYNGISDGNGKNGCFGLINMGKQSKVDFEFKFVYAGTDIPVIMNKFFFSIYDLDRTGNDRNKEKVTFTSPVESWFTMPDSELLESGSNDGTLSFESTMPGNKKDNPKDPEKLMGSVAALRVVTVQYPQGLSSVSLSFEVVKGTGGRNFLFAGRSSFVNDNGKLPKCTAEGVCKIIEDPHITVFDGAQVSLLAFQGIADSNYLFDAFDDKWLVRSNNVSIQARYIKIADDGETKTFMRAMAIGGPFLQGNTLVVGGLNEQVTWNGAEILTSQTSEFNVEGLIKATRHNSSSRIEDFSEPNPGIDIQLPEGVGLTFNRLHRYINAAIKMQPQDGGQDGLCGNFNGIGTDDGLEMVAQRSNADVLFGQSIFPGSFADLAPPEFDDFA